MACNFDIIFGVSLFRKEMKKKSYSPYYYEAVFQILKNKKKEGFKGVTVGNRKVRNNLIRLLRQVSEKDLSDFIKIKED